MNQMVDLIEMYLAQQKVAVPILKHIRSEIFRISQNNKWSEQRKLAELGLIYFYATSGKQFPYGVSFVDDRANSIDLYFSELFQQMDELKEKKVYPYSNGATNCLLQACVRMVFTMDGEFNLGGCYAIEELLNTPISLLISEEMRAQILSITDKMIEDMNFRNLFKVPFSICPDLEKYIKIDLKMPLNEELTFVHVRWGLLKALFTSARQDDEPNCYTIGAVRNFISNYPEEVLALLIDILKTGMLKREGRSIPIIALLNNRRTSKQEFQNKVNPLYTKTQSFSVACECLDVNPRVDSKEKIFLNELFDQTFGDAAEVAKDIHLSYSQNFLLEIVISCAQFSANNFINPQTTIPILSSPKMRLIKDLKSHALVGIPNPMLLPSLREWNHFINRFEKSLEENLFLIDQTSGEAKESGSRLQFDFHSTGLIKHPTLINKAALPFIRRLFGFENGKMQPLDRLTSVGSYLAERVQKLCLKTDSLDLQFCQTSIIKYLKSDEGRKNLANIVSNSNRQHLQLGWSHYVISDSFFMIQIGNDVQNVYLSFDYFKRLSLNNSKTFRGSNVQEYFYNLCHVIHNYTLRNSKYFTKKDPLLLINSGEHIFNLNPRRFEEYFSNPNEIQNTIIKPAQATLNRKGSDDDRKAILEEFFGAKLPLEAMEGLSADQLDMQEFYKKAVAWIENKDLTRFNQKFNQYFQQISVEEFDGVISYLLTDHIPQLDEQTKIDLYHTLTQDCREKLCYSPEEYADFLHRHLLHLTNPIYIPRYELERSLRSYCGLPQIIDLGSLNWSWGRREKYETSKLIIYFDFAKGKLTFGKRSGKNIFPFENDFSQSILKGGKVYFDS